MPDSDIQTPLEVAAALARAIYRARRWRGVGRHRSGNRDDREIALGGRCSLKPSIPSRVDLDEYYFRLLQIQYLLYWCEEIFLHP